MIAIPIKAKNAISLVNPGISYSNGVLVSLPIGVAFAYSIAACDVFVGTGVGVGVGVGVTIGIIDPFLLSNA